MPKNNKPMSNPAKTRIIVTGGTGFIGRYVVELLSAEGFDPLVTTFNSTAQKSASLSPNIDLVNIDLTDSEKVNELLDEADALCTEGKFTEASATLATISGMVAKTK